MDDDLTDAMAMLLQGSQFWINAPDHLWNREISRASTPHPGELNRFFAQQLSEFMINAAGDAANCRCHTGERCFSGEYE